MLFVAEGDDGVDAHGAAGGDVAGQQGDSDQQYKDQGEGGRVGGLDGEEQACEQAGEGKRSAETEDGSQEGGAHGFAYD